MREFLHTEHQGHGHWCYQPGLCTPEQKEGQESMKGSSEVTADKKVSITFHHLPTSLLERVKMQFVLWEFKVKSVKTQWLPKPIHSTARKESACQAQPVYRL